MTDTLQYYLAKWELTAPEQLAETFTSTVYTVQQNDRTVVLKILNLVGVEDEQNGAAALQHFAGHGAVKLLNADTNAHLLEYVPGVDLLPMVQRNGDIEATRIIGEVLNKLHVVRENTVPGSITSLRRRFRALQQQASNDKLAGRDTIYRRGATQADMLLATAREQCLLHGDMHHENVRHHPERGWLAFDPKGLFGERTFDAANTLCNPVGMPDLVKDEARLLKNADILAETMEMDRDRLLQFTFAYACLSAVWSAEDEQSSDLALAVAHMLEKHL